MRMPRCARRRLSSEATFASMVGPISITGPTCRSTSARMKSASPHTAPAPHVHNLQHSCTGNAVRRHVPPTLSAQQDQSSRHDPCLIQLLLSHIKSSHRAHSQSLRGVLLHEKRFGCKLTQEGLARSKHCFVMCAHDMADK